MDARTYQYLADNKKLFAFIRQEPYWYRHLSRHGLERIPELEKEAKKFYGQTMSQRMERINQQIHMASILMNVADMLKD